MLILITYDVTTSTKEGRKRLNLIAKKCVRHGQRVQNSVFECYLDTSILRKFQAELEAIINPEEDSLRIYNLGNKYMQKVTHIGIKPSIPIEGDLVV